MKPSNVLVVEDGPRVIDFGIASGVSNTRLTMTNVAVGTPAYMSPEQARDSRSVRGASDIFSLGSTLVFAATGHAPFHGANPVETVFMLLREGPDLAGLPDELRPLIESCMRMEAEQRPTPADLQAQLAPHLFSSGGDDTRHAPRPGCRPARWRMIEQRRRRTRRRGAGRAAAAGTAPAGPPARRPAGPRAPPARSAAAPPRPQQPPRGPAAAAARGRRPVRLRRCRRVADRPRAAGRAGAPTARRPPAPAPGTEWVRRRAGAAPAPAAGPGPAPVPARPRPAARPPGRTWRPWRFRMSNDVWGTPVVDGGLLYVTSFEVHALDVASGRRQFKTRDVAWTMAVAGGRIHASDGPQPVRARRGGRQRALAYRR